MHHLPQKPKAKSQKHVAIGLQFHPFNNNCEKNNINVNPVTDTQSVSNTVLLTYMLKREEEEEVDEAIF
jgi:flagellar basal body P-ring protein FlgI